MYQYNNLSQELKSVLDLHSEILQLPQFSNSASEDLDFDIQTRFDRFLADNHHSIPTIDSWNQFYIVMIANNDRDYTPGEMDRIREVGYNFSILGKGREVSIQQQIEILSKEMDRARSNEERGIISDKLKQLKVEVFRELYDNLNQSKNSDNNYARESQEALNSKNTVQTVEALKVKNNVLRPLESSEPATGKDKLKLDGYKEEYLSKYYYPEGYKLTESDIRKLKQDPIYAEFTNPYATGERLEIIQNIVDRRYRKIINYIIESTSFGEERVKFKSSRVRAMAEAEKEMVKKGLIPDRNQFQRSLDSSITKVRERQESDRKAKQQAEVDSDLSRDSQKSQTSEENLIKPLNEAIFNPDNKIEINLAQDVLTNLESPIDMAQDAAMSIAIEVAKKAGFTAEQISNLGDIKNITGLVTTILLGDPTSPISIGASFIQVAPIIIDRFEQYAQHEQAYSTAKLISEKQAEFQIGFTEIAYLGLTDKMSIESREKLIEFGRDSYWKTKLDTLKQGAIRIDIAQLEQEQFNLNDYIQSLESQLSSDEVVSDSSRDLIERELKHAKNYAREVDNTGTEAVKIFREMAKCIDLLNQEIDRGIETDPKVEVDKAIDRAKTNLDYNIIGNRHYWGSSAEHGENFRDFRENSTKKAKRITSEIMGESYGHKFMTEKLGYTIILSPDEKFQSFSQGFDAVYLDVKTDKIVIGEFKGQDSSESAAQKRITWTADVCEDIINRRGVYKRSGDKERELAFKIKEQLNLDNVRYELIRTTFDFTIGDIYSVLEKRKNIYKYD